MKLICAWCKVVLRDGTEPASHGICTLCLPATLVDAGPPMLPAECGHGHMEESLDHEYETVLRGDEEWGEIAHHVITHVCVACGYRKQDTEPCDCDPRQSAACRCKGDCRC